MLHSLAQKCLKAAPMFGNYYLPCRAGIKATQDKRYLALSEGSYKRRVWFGTGSHASSTRVPTLGIPGFGQNWEHYSSKSCLNLFRSCRFTVLCAFMWRLLRIKIAKGLKQKQLVGKSGACKTLCLEPSKIGKLF